MTTDPGTIEGFRRGRRTIVKAIQDARVVGSMEERFGYARELKGDESLIDASVTPVLLQRLIGKVADVRVTVVDRSVFAVRISTPTNWPIATPAAKAARLNALLDERGIVSVIFGSDAAVWERPSGVKKAP